MAGWDGHTLRLEAIGKYTSGQVPRRLERNEADKRAEMEVEE